MKTVQINRNILAAYPKGYRAKEALSLDSLHSLGTARHWRIEASEGAFCLRRRSKHNLPLERLQFQQAVLWHVVCEGIDFVPLPFETMEHHGFVDFDGSYWELLPWLDGGGDEDHFIPSRFPLLDDSEPEADSYDEFLFEEPFFDEPGRDEVRREPVSLEDSCEIPGKIEPFHVASAMMSLAQCHLAASSFPLPTPPRALSRRARRQWVSWESYLAGRFTELARALNRTRARSMEQVLARSGRAILEHAIPEAETIISRLELASQRPVPVQAIIGNASFRHLRFNDQGLCGMIDFKRIGVDSVAWDVASLLASLAERETDFWHFGLKAYQSVRPLSSDEWALTNAFDLSQSLLEGLEWLTRIFLKNEFFSDAQLQELKRRIDSWNWRFVQDHRNRYSA